MDIKRSIELLQYEVECITRQDTEKCNRDCANCDLVQDTDELLHAYYFTLAILFNLLEKDENQLDISD